MSERSDDWGGVDELFARAQPLSPTERAELLSRAAPDVRAEVESLLSFAEGEHFIDEPPAGELVRNAVESGVPTEMPPEARRRVGPFELRKLIGTGGMGAVYLADRVDGELRQRVAVKLVKRGMDTDRMLERFHRERFALAQLAHPGIAHFLDAGATDDGSPYLVMEYVEGVPIDLYCRRNELAVEERIAIFRKVCAAVDHAHRNWIVHRDLKPANILVTPDGEPKLLDFGIAKLVSPEGEATLTRTAEGSGFFSPAYASPEQVSGLPITPASDVYSLGVVLYRLFSDRHPLEFTDFSSRAVERVVTEQEPIPVSAAVQDARVAHRLRGDLDNIVARALRKEPGERFPSARELSDDLGRFLAGRPVLSTAPTARYRMTKFVRRHRAVCVAAAVVAVSILVGAGVALYQGQRARIAAAESQRAIGILAGVLPAIDGEFERSLPVAERRARLEEVSRVVVPALEREPARQVEVMRSLARGFSHLDLFESSAVWWDRTIELLTRAEPLDIASLTEAVVAVADIKARLGRAEEAHGDVERVISLVRPVGGEPAVTRMRLTSVKLLDHQGRFEQAAAVMSKVLADQELEAGPSHALQNVLTTRARRAWNIERDLEAAERWFEAALAVARERRAGDHMDLVSRLMECGTFLQDVGRYDEALERIREARDISLRLRAPDDPGHANDALHMGLLLKDMGRYEEAEREVRSALAHFESWAPPGSDDVALARVALAKVLADAGRFNEAEATVLESLAAFRSRRSLVRLSVALTLLGRVRVLRGAYEEALVALEEARAIQDRVRPAVHWECAKVRSLIGAAYTGLGDYERAEPLLLEAHEVIERDRGLHHHRTRDSLERIAALASALDNPPRLAPYVERLAGWSE